MDISSLINSSASVTLAISPLDLKEFAEGLMQAARDEALKEKREEKMLTADEVALKTGVSRNTLWRWAKNGYLTPVKVGRTPMYREKDVFSIINGMGRAL